MSSEEYIHKIIQRHACGDRDLDLMNELDRLAFSAYRDPWEEPRRPSATPSPLRRLPLDGDEYDPDTPERVDVATLELFVGIFARTHLRRKAYPFLAVYEYLADPEPERNPRILMQSSNGRHFACSFLRNLKCADADLPKVPALCAAWNASRAFPEARMLEGQLAEQLGAPAQRCLALELEVDLGEENPAITLTVFQKVLKDLITASGEFWNRLGLEIEA